MKRKIRIGTALLSACIITISAAGCSGNSQDTNGNGSVAKLRYWMQLNPNVSTTASDVSQTEFGKELSKRTGIEVEYIHPPVGQETEQFNLMIASRELPDIIEYTWDTFPGGPEKAISDGYLLELNEIFEKDSPNIMKFLTENPEYEKQLKTDTGRYFCYPFIRGDSYLLTSGGPAMRKDWLDDLGLAEPETIDEWYTALTAFKEKKGASAPLSFNVSLHLDWGVFSGAYGETKGFYVENGTVKFGGIEPGYKQFLETFHKWYDEKLLDNSFMTADSKTLDANILNGISGAMTMSVGNGIGRLTASAQGKIEGFELTPLKFPVLNKGEKPKFGHIQLPVTGSGAAITAQCSNVQAAAKLLDYGYGEEGHMLNNFGIEGKSYTMVDGYPTYTEEIMDNPEGLSITAAMAKYLKAYATGPFVQDKRYMEQYAALPQQKKAVELWSDTDALSHAMPLIYVLPEETSEIAKITTDVTTYQDEMISKFIMGVEPLENFDTYVARIREMGIDRAIEIKQSALERFNNR